MFQIATDEIFQDGQIIFKEGSSGDWIYLIESGAVEIYKKAGDETHTLAVLQPGDVFGEIAFFAQIPRTTSAKAIGTTTLGVIDRTVLDKEFNQLSSDFRMILKSLVFKLLKENENALQPKCHRKEPRVPKVLTLRYKTRKGFVKAFSRDMSFGGIFIKTSKPFAIGEQFVLNLNLPGSSESIKIKCKVSWNQTEKEDLAEHPPGMGVEFIELNSADRQRLRAALIKD